MQNVQGSNRAPQLQFLRFIAFLMIFFWHSQAWLPEWGLRQNTATSMVSFFFVLSGVAKGYSSLFKETPLSVKSYFKNYGQRLLKVYPLYAITMLYSVSVSPIPLYISNGNLEGLKDMLIQLLKNMLMIQSWFNKEYFSYNGVAWFLSTLMFLFLFTDPAVALFKKLVAKKKGIVWLCGCLAVIIIATTAYNYSVRNLNQQFWAYVFPPARIGEYLGGIIVGILARRASLKDQNCALFTALEIAALGIWTVAMFIPLDTFGTRIANWLFPNFLGLFIFAMGKGLISKLLSFGPLVALGDVSFECFLIHQVVLMRFKASVPFTGQNLLTNLFSIGFCLCATLVLSFAANRALKRKN